MFESRLGMRLWKRSDGDVLDIFVNCLSRCEAGLNSPIVR